MNVKRYSKSDRLSFFQDLYEEAKSYAENTIENFSKNLEQYKGSDVIDNSHEKASLVRNITYELVESQVTSYIPTPAVTPKKQSERSIRNAKCIEVLLNNKRDELPFEEMNDLDERYNPIYGGSVWLVEWDESIKSHHSVGDIKISCLSPMHFVGQPNMYRIEDMEYCFVKVETTKDEVVRKYGVSPSVAEDTESENSTDDKTATVIVCYYKDDEDTVCEYIWSNDVELLHIENYFARRKEICTKCGKRKELCTCENPEYEEAPTDYEILDRDIVLSDGTIIPAMSPVLDEYGNPVYETKKVPFKDEMGNIAMEGDSAGALPVLVDVHEIKREPTRIPYYTPKRIPIVIRKNTSEENNLFGQSDVAYIRPQQQAINKIESRIQEKLLKAGVFPLVPENFTGDLNNSIFGQVFRCDQNTVKLYGRVDLQVDISQDVAEAERLYDHAKRILGITDSYQGQYDASAQSGKAKQIQVQQAAGRLDSKRQMKNAAYAEIDKIIFQYYLAYVDEERPMIYRDSSGAFKNYIFSRYDFVERDSANEYYIDDSYLFHTDASMDVERNRELLWQENRANFQMGAYGNPQTPQAMLIYWQNMERARYPFAAENVERIKEDIQQQMLAQQQQIQAMQADAAMHEKYEEFLKSKTQGGRV